MVDFGSNISFSDDSPKLCSHMGLEYSLYPVIDSINKSKYQPHTNQTLRHKIPFFSVFSHWGANGPWWAVSAAHKAHNTVVSWQNRQCWGENNNIRRVLCSSQVFGELSAHIFSNFLVLIPSWRFTQHQGKVSSSGQESSMKTNEDTSAQASDWRTIP